MKNALYFDYCATTPVDERVLIAMQPFFCEIFGNSASQLHPYGWEAESAVDKARKQISTALQVLPREIFFTSGATESNNWAIQGLIEAWQQESPHQPIHIISSNAEHNSILRVLEYVQKYRNIDVDFLPVGRDGRITTEQVERAIKPSTKLVSLIWANNELGSLNPMQEISQLTRERKIYLHSDATQAVGKIPLNLEHTKLDLMSFSSHKIYGPKGVGALYIRGQNPSVQIQPLLHGGGQERGLRSGTVNVPGVVGFGMAMELVHHSIEQESDKAWKMRKSFLEELKSAGINFHLNGSPTHTVPQVLNISFDAHASAIQFTGVAYSKGSACHSENPEPSHVLTAIGLPASDYEKTLRFSFGRMTTTEDFQKFFQIILKKLKAT